MLSSLSFPLFSFSPRSPVGCSLVCQNIIKFWPKPIKCQSIPISVVWTALKCVAGAEWLACIGVGVGRSGATGLYKSWYKFVPFGTQSWYKLVPLWYGMMVGRHSVTFHLSAVWCCATTWLFVCSSLVTLWNATKSKQNFKLVFRIC